MIHSANSIRQRTILALLPLAMAILVSSLVGAQSRLPAAAKAYVKPKLVVLLVVDQMRADYVEKFLPQWTGGLKRLVEEGAWFRDAAYPYAATETCVGHATISTGAFPATHGMVANAWWDRQDKKMVTCTEDPHPGVKNIGYAGATPKGADTAWRMAVPSFAEEQAKSHPAKADFGKTWSLALPASAYWYDEKSLGAVPPEGWDLLFPHLLGRKTGAGGADDTFYEQWASSPYADTA